MYDPYGQYQQAPQSVMPAQLAQLSQLGQLGAQLTLPAGMAGGFAGYAPAPLAYAPAPAAANVAAPGGYGDEVRTIFLSGFPQDVRERELNNMLRFLPGYQASQLNWKNGQAQGFAMFADGPSARHACNTLNGLPFDDGVSLRAEIARKNMYLHDGAPPAGGGPKRMRTGEYGDGGGGMGGGGMGGGGMGGGGMGGDRRGGQRSAGGLQQQDNPPCNTLFVGNLGASVDREELERVFSTQPGYNSIRFTNNPRGTTCFVEFDCVENAAATHAALQAHQFASNDRGPVRLQYSKQPLNRKRDASGQSVGGAGGGGGGGGMSSGGYGAPNMINYIPPPAAPTVIP